MMMSIIIIIHHQDQSSDRGADDASKLSSGYASAAWRGVAADPLTKPLRELEWEQVSESLLSLSDGLVKLHANANACL